MTQRISHIAVGPEGQERGTHVSLRGAEGVAGSSGEPAAHPDMFTCPPRPCPGLPSPPACHPPLEPGVELWGPLALRQDVLAGGLREGRMRAGGGGKRKGRRGEGRREGSPFCMFCVFCSHTLALLMTNQGTGFKRKRKPVHGIRWAPKSPPDSHLPFSLRATVCSSQHRSTYCVPGRHSARTGASS